ncbi:signal transduction histidine kinase/ligand-binding sensor domain-containing protein/DNA-binding response OmpR family regulator [Catalinimonas alkaloidigena]|uniref:hybrid sensor histidine kinase/response regulator transcription factor n=1 Tax=Catalinimonas alkaloidigena TaxID=1075417 RepID=UPI0024067BE8|nr:two-component regulator propeller domain-containing protein [Catalinimonas alkaloidigena]MDF9797814.1 signal transduction histidine kinase/ligand-binding sensor domain-containing protein/DNA-binding response OmpR family regulator [Catalinimonas alkaloidigena]
MKPSSARQYRFCLLLFLFHWICLNLIAQQNHLDFQHMGKSIGLSQAHVWTIYQDNKGYIWLGTFNRGLIRFDGNDFKIFKHDPTNPNSISGDWVNVIYEDKKGNFWVGTRYGGLNLFLPEYDIFYHFRANKEDSLALNNDLVRDILEDQEGNLWVSTDNGLDLFKYSGDPLGENTFIHYQYNEQDKNSISSDYITDLFIDSNDILWIGTYGGGFNKYDKNKKHFIRFAHNTNDQNSLSHNVVTSITEDSKGNLWIATLGGGLNLFDPETNHFTHYQNVPNEPESIPSNLIWSICVDDKDNLWLGTEDKGLVFFNQHISAFQHYTHDVLNEKSISANQVFSVFISREKDLWVGTWGGGVNFSSGNTKAFYTYLPSNKEGSISHHVVTSLFARKDGRVWVGTEGGGLNLLDLQNGRFTHFKHNPGVRNALSSNEIMTVLEDRQGFVWVGTRGSGLTVLKPDLHSVYKKYDHLPDDSTTLSSHTVRAIFEDTEGNIWIGTDEGLNVLNRNTDDFTSYQWPVIANNFVTHIYPYDEDNFWVGTRNGLSLFSIKKRSSKNYTPDHTLPGSISHQWISGIYKDSKENTWIGTSYGLNLYQAQHDSFVTFYENDGLGSNGVGGIVEDDLGYLWISGNGFSKFDVSQGIFKNYDEVNGTTVCVKAMNGEIIAGSLNGLVRFDPDSITENPVLPPVYITEFYLFNEPSGVKVSENSQLKQVAAVDQVTLDYQQSVFSLAFTALQYTYPEKSKYAYRLMGFNDDWVYTASDRRMATYTNLDPGTYQFQVKATNNDGLWNQHPTTLDIIIKPPPWQSWWAYLMYILALLGLIYGLRKYELKRIWLNHQLQLKSLEALRLTEVDAIKSRFFANISHEFRTPLTLILGPVDRFLKKFTEESTERNELLLIRRNAKRLLALINQLLDIAKIESGSMKLEASENDLIAFLRPVLLSFESLAESKRIDYAFDFRFDSLNLYFDPDKLEKIVLNLVSNALKFTPARGKVHIEILPVEEGNPGFVAIKVIDTGIGIPQDELERVYDRFYQTDRAHQHKFGGTGIGLALTKELVSLHHGEILAESVIGKGSTFTVVLPLGKNHFGAEEIADKSSTEKPVTDVEGHEQTETLRDGEMIKASESIILVVEDNPDLREYIKLHLSDHPKTRHFRVAEAIHGKEGFEQALRLIPDLIIADLMMPEMDGLALCAQLKKDERTSHIPVVMLTAKADRKSKLEGLESGADDYMSKPFDADELMARITNLTAQRELLRKKYAQSFTFEPEKITVNSVDQRFLERVKFILEKRMDDPALDVNDFSHEIGMSRSQFYRKLKSILGQSPNQFIRDMRLARAAQLFDEHFGTVAEVAYAVGFSNLSYFTKSFKDKFNKLPSGYSSKKTHNI